jgi:hypothetical protein
MDEGVRVACLTMGRDEDFFLPIWARYYGGLFGPGNLFVIDHNSARPPALPETAPRPNVLRLPFDETRHAARALGRHKDFDGQRFRMISQIIAALRVFYDVVIFNDADEIFVTDPAAFPDLRAFLDSDLPEGVVFAGVGLNLFHDEGELPLDPGRPVLAQRRHFAYRINHSKPHIVATDSAIEAHGAAAPILLHPDLYLLHLKYVEDSILPARAGARFDAFRRGWGSGASAWNPDGPEHQLTQAEMRALPREWREFVHRQAMGELLGRSSERALGAPDGPERLRVHDPGMFLVREFLRRRDRLRLDEGARHELPERFRAAPS